jgi:tight adherence protein B
MDLNLLLSALLAVGVALAFLGLDLVVTARSANLHRSIDGYAAFPPAQNVQGDQAKSGGGRLQNTRLGSQIATELARADLPVTPSEYILTNMLIVLLGFVVGWALFRSPLLALLGAVVGLVAPRLYVRYLQHKRHLAFDSQLPGALVLLSNTLRAGHGLSQAIETVSKEVAPPISVEFARVTREVALGLPMQRALDNLVRRNPSLDLEMVITAINLNREIGGNLADVLDGIASTVRDRIRIAADIRAITSQQRFTAGVLTLLPPALGLIIFVINPEYIASLWQSTCGLMMLGLGVLMMFFGYLVVRRILAVKF